MRSSRAEIVVVPLLDYKLQDSWFAEIEFYAESKIRRKVFVPKDQIVTLFQGESRETAAESIGFKLADEEGKGMKG